MCVDTWILELSMLLFRAKSWEAEGLAASYACFYMSGCIPGIVS
jgi:hypothetical protein